MKLVSRITAGMSAALGVGVLGWLLALPAVQAQTPAPIPPHPSTQLHANLVTPRQMEKWEKELSNWGRWGPKDERGTLNLITPQKTQAALRLADAQPSGVEGWPRPIHDIALPIMGTPLVDNGYFEDLAPLAARLKRWEFMVSWTMMPIPHGTATPFMGLATF